jgi:hypothetical protein|tara:strand:- start:14265 stop:14576 length:312 start_codon:yes stop_codon:yes gene_type:complete
MKKGLDLGSLQQKIDKLISNVILIYKMSQRLGMADGRCFTINSSNQLYNNYVMKENGISFEDNYSFRKLLQQKGPELLRPSQDLQKDACGSCDKALLKMPNIY